MIAHRHLPLGLWKKYPRAGPVRVDVPSYQNVDASAVGAGGGAGGAGATADGVSAALAVYDPVLGEGVAVDGAVDEQPVNTAMPAAAATARFLNTDR
ncbi:MAG: hypothetical protein ACSLE3_13475 [Microbacteriaceae bacterium]